MPLAMLVEWTGLPDRKAIHTLLFKMQRERLLSGEVEPLVLPATPLAQSLTELLAALSDCGRALLGNEDGLCMATAGFTHAESERLAALSAGLYPLYRQHRRHGSDAIGSVPSWTLSTEDGGAVAVRSLHLGDRIFHLVAGGTPVWNAAGRSYRAPRCSVAVTSASAERQVKEEGSCCSRQRIRMRSGLARNRCKRC